MAAIALLVILLHQCCSIADAGPATTSSQHVTGKQQIGLEQARQQGRRLQQNADVPALTPYGGLKMEGAWAHMQHVPQLSKHLP